MMQTVQLAIADGIYAAALREALSHSCAWHVESVSRPDPSRRCVTVIDQAALHGLLRKVRDLGMPLVSVIRVEPRQATASNVKSTAKENET